MQLRLAAMFIALTVLLGLGSAAIAKGRSDFTLKLDGIYAHHTTNPYTPASQRIVLFAEEKYKASNRWDLVASGLGWIETLYTGNFDYPNELRGEDFQDGRVQDGYAQYKRGPWLSRYGWQQVAWGETFGNYYADFINPKDLRYGIPPNMSQIRLGQPMANIKYVQGHSAVQALLLPQPAFNILPLPGSDFSPPLESLTRFQKVVVQRQRQLIFGRDTEWGIRGSHTIGQYDLSLFYFNGFDRSPYYQIDPRSVLGQLLVINERHDRVIYMGGAMAAEIEGHVLRSELVQIQGRQMPILRSGTLSNAATDELGYAISLDFPTWQRLNFTLQYSGSQLREDFKYLTARRHAQYLGARALLGLFESSNWETLLTYVTDDQSSRLQSSFTTPLDASFDLSSGIELFSGASDSEFGRISRASRIFANLRYKFVH